MKKNCQPPNMYHLDSVGRLILERIRVICSNVKHKKSCLDFEFKLSKTYGYMPHRMAKKKEGLSKSQNTFYPGFYFIRS